MKKTLTVFAFLFALAGIKAVARQKIDYTPLPGADTSLAPIKTAFNDKLKDIKIVGLGEATHGDKTTFAFNFNMVKYLISERGFKRLILEAPNSTCVPFNKFVLTDSAFTQAQIDTLVCVTLSVGANRDRQFADLLKWLKEYNLAHKTNKVSIKGMSLDATPSDTMLNNYIKPYDPISYAAITQKWKTPGYTRINKWNDIFSWQDTQTQLINNLPDAVKNRITFDLNNSKMSLELYLDISLIHIDKNSLVVATRDGGKEYVSKDNFFWKLRNNPDYQRKDSLNRFTRIFKMRDSLMAVYTLDETAGTRAIVWAHNVHVSRLGDKTMGDYLGKALGSQYFIVITDYSAAGYINIFTPLPGTRKSPDPMAGHTLVKELKNKYGMQQGIVSSAELTKLGYTDVGIHGAGIEGDFFINKVSVNSFDALAVLGALYPCDVY